MSGSGVRRGWRVREDPHAANREVIAVRERLEESARAGKMLSLRPCRQCATTGRVRLRLGACLSAGWRLAECPGCDGHGYHQP